MSTAKMRKFVDGAPALCYNFLMKNCEDIVSLSEKFGINAEYKSEDFYPVFRAAAAGTRILVLADKNTARYAEPFW